ncbi:13476_t:CDS:2, partial [Acaulospora morrowiae]
MLRLIVKSILEIRQFLYFRVSNHFLHIKNKVLFTGWFGPIGVGAIYCSTLAKHELGNGDSHNTLSNIVLPVVFFLVFSSIMVHGITIPLVMISKRINTRTFTAGSVYNQVSRLPVIRIGQDVFFTTDDKGNILPS